MQNLVNQIARYQEIERRGLLEKLPIEKQQAWAEVKRRGLDKKILSGEQIGTSQPAEPLQSPYSTMDKAKYTLRSAGEGATFGLGDLVAGYAATQAGNVADFTHGKDWKTRKAGLQRFFDYMTPIGQVQMLKEGTFGKERADFIKEQEEFDKHHPWLNAAGEFVGGALTGGAGAAKNIVGKQGIKALMGAGAREATKFGTAYGAGSGLTQDPDKISVYDALKGAAIGGAGGAVFGAALPPAIAVGAKVLSPVVKGGKRVFNKIAKILKKDAQQANQALGNAGYVATDLAPENKDFLKLFADNPEGTMAAIESGDPLIAHANSLQLGKTKGAIVANENAEQAYLAAKRAFDEKKIAKGDKFADILLGENSGKEAVERITDEARNKYKPLYKEVMKMGEIDLPQEIIANETILGAIQEAQGRAGYTKLKANNVRVLDKAKRVLQDKYKSLKKAGKEDEAGEYQIAKEELVNFMDSKLPQYSEARKAFMTRKELEEFVEKGQDIKTLSIKDVENLAKSMSAEEKEAFKSGVADIVRRSLDNTQKEGADVIGKAFDLPLRRKLNILGIGDDDLIKEIAQEMKTNANFRAVGYGSDTAVNLRNAMKFKGPFSKVASVVDAVTSPVRTIKSLAEVADNKLQQLSAEEIARLMFDPKALAEEAQKPQHQRKIAEILRKSKQSESGQSIAGYLGGKIKEKGGFAMNPLSEGEGKISKVLNQKGSKVLNSLGEPVAKTEEGVKNFGKFFKGSKVVDEKGNPLVVYHGTINKFSEFSKAHIGTNTKNKGIFGNGFYFTDDPKLASNYIREGGKVVKGEKGNLMPAYLSLKKPFLWNSKNIELAKKLGFPKGRVKNNQLLPLVEEKQILKFTENLKKNGYDGVIYQYKDGTKELVAFEPTQIKSVKNQGTFDTKNPNIYKSLIGGLGISQILKSKENK